MRFHEEESFSGFGEMRDGYSRSAELWRLHTCYGSSLHRRSNKARCRDQVVAQLFAN
jgi:hypothetical protein